MSPSPIEGSSAIAYIDLKGGIGHMGLNIEIEIFGKSKSVVQTILLALQINLVL